MPSGKSNDKGKPMNITRLAKEYKVATSLIRYWESEFEILNPGRDEKGNRIYTEKDIENFKTIYHLVKERGFTLDGAKSALEKNIDSTKDKIELIDSLKEVKGFLEELKNK